jgi:hypothetical protein
MDRGGGGGFGASRARPSNAAIYASKRGSGSAGEAVAGLRRDGLTRPLPGPAIERLFSLGFALDQLRRDAEDLAERVAELAPAAAQEAVPAQ